MGISRGAAKLIAMTLRDRPPGGKVLTLGVQAVEVTRGSIESIVMRDASPGAARDRAMDPAAPLNQQALFEWLGFDAVESLDYYDAEGPTYVVDLNRPLPAALIGRFDMVYDGGTLEHCFNTVQALENIVAALKPRGRVIHHVPLNNWVDHGFYQFSPTFFFDFYHANGFGGLSMKLHFMARRQESFIAYDPLIDPKLPYGLGRGTKSLVFFAAEKPEQAPAQGTVYPIQSRYRAAFGNEASTRQSRKGLKRLQASILKRSIVWRSRRI